MLNYLELKTKLKRKFIVLLYLIFIKFIILFIFYFLSYIYIALAINKRNKYYKFRNLLITKFNKKLKKF